MTVKLLPVAVLGLALAFVVTSASASHSPTGPAGGVSQSRSPVTERSFLTADGGVQTVDLLLASDVPASRAEQVTDSFFNENFPGRAVVDYVTTGDTWPVSSMPLTIYYNQNVAGEPPLKDAVDFAVAKWNSTPGSTYRLVDGGATAAASGTCQAPYVADGRNTLSFVDTGNPLVLGLTCVLPNTAHQVVEADIIFNPTVLFSNASVTPTNAFDLMSVVLHELGHFAGLNHPCQPGSCAGYDSIMVPTLDQGQQRRTPRPDDVRGLNSMYPASRSTRPSRAFTAVVAGDDPR